MIRASVLRQQRRWMQRGLRPMVGSPFDFATIGKPTHHHGRPQEVVVVTQQQQSRSFFFSSIGSNPILEMTQDPAALPDFTSVSPQHLIKAGKQVHTDYEQAWAAEEGSSDNTILDRLEKLEESPTTLYNISVMLLQMHAFDRSWIKAVSAAQTTLQLPHKTSVKVLEALKDYEGDNHQEYVDKLIQTYQKRGVELLEEDRESWEILTNAVLQLESSFVEEQSSPLSTKDQLQNLYTLQKVKQKQAEMLGYEDYSTLALHGRMMNKKEQVSALLDEIGERALVALDGHEDDAEIEIDMTPYLTLDGVLQGLFALSRALFGIEIAEDPNPRGWYPDVRLFHVTNTENQERIGSFYLDPFARTTKKKAVYMGPLTSGNTVFINLTVKPPAWDDMPTPMQLDDTVGLFHEFGHVLQLLLADHRGGLDRNVDSCCLDVIEVVPHFMEHWVFETPILQTLAHLSSTGTEIIPESVIGEIQEQRRQSKIHDTLRRVFLSKLELELYSNREDSDESLVALQRRLAEHFTPHELLPKSDLTPLVQLVEANGLHQKVVAQYRYLLSEVISTDLFEAFTDAGLENQDAMKELGGKFRKTLLKPGVLVDAQSALQELKGHKEISTRAYFKLYNL